MSLDDFVVRLTGLLEDAGVPYMVTGSFASSIHGHPRSTQDLDLVIDTDVDGLRRLLARLPADAYYVDEHTALDALRRRRQFNVIDMATGWKADLIVRKNRPFSEVEFARKRPARDAALIVASPEDVILSKLEWAKKTGSDRQLRDVVGVMETQPHLDVAYIERWVDELSLAEPWARARALKEEP